MTDVTAGTVSVQPPDPAEGSHVERGIVEHPTSDDFHHARNVPVDQTWFQRAVFYEVLVRAFADSDSDGSGDLRGLIDKLDYLAWLGVDCLWLPPFYDSPLRDGGYDIRDFYKVLPEFGTVDDFVALLDAAHKRGIRVITDLVMNHTSDQHPWFQESRRDPDGPYGDFYVWSDSDDGYADARIIFVDTEESNWTFDPVRRQFYWHRFFSHQPDLNYANPAVQNAMLDVLRFWLDLGIDGFRLDAVPYLFESEGTNCENLPETHAFLRHCRKVIDDEFPGRVLLAEANQWPADVVAYFGESESGGDECHMAFHFPLMPRIFMAVRRESRFPISEILANTPAIPANCQWGIFLRNHDELTLEMVTDEERDYMYTEYAKDPRMKANIGIRRRLAPLLENDRNQQELFTALLLSLPGSPVLYYGDEIGMGDNIWLGDRDGVRTPMQWTPDRNAGFSTSTPGRIYLPVNQDPIYGYQSVNVEAQRDSSTSLLNWTRLMLSVRRRHDSFAVGTFQELGGSNPAVLAFLRHHEDDVVLCVNNLSRFPQPIELNLQAWSGYSPIELTGRVLFPRIGQLPYLLTLPGHGFYWFQLTPPSDEDDPTRAAERNMEDS
ncbi:maltose alpha-D-glucosyltransferase [Asanoa siamensis]|uniref:maltose alpha-D-glucosyltransferase n=1 Tax=Asanoa siamensis TaxID=926357 RepID=A0ABQ4CQF2_9ACTN|nr:maltose alpha-D-glucosyltransferase [Asanoa siamensis]GIF73510.1 trehalose synthase/amylase TreS [Asanoa siamensis]